MPTPVTARTTTAAPSVNAGAATNRLPSVAVTRGPTVTATNADASNPATNRIAGIVSFLDFPSTMHQTFP